MGIYKRSRVSNFQTMSISKSIDILINNTSHTLRTKTNIPQIFTFFTFLSIAYTAR
jgi:hypothetical protein